MGTTEGYFYMPFHRESNWDSKRLSFLPKIMQLEHERQNTNLNLNLDFIKQQFDGLNILKVSAIKQLDPIQNTVVILLQIHDE